MLLHCPLYLRGMMEITKGLEMAGHAGPVYQVAYGRSEGHVLTASGDQFIAEWDPQLGRASNFAVKMEQPCFSLAFIERLHVLIAGTGNGGIHVIDLNEKAEIHHLKVHEKGVFAFLDLPEHGLFISGGGEGSVCIWNPKTWKLLRQLPIASNKIRQFLVHEDRLYVASSDGGIYVLDLPWFNVLNVLQGHEGGTYSLCLHPSKPLLISGGKDAHLRFWHLETQKEVRSIPAHNFGIYAIQANPSGTLVATASRDKSIKLWFSDTFEPVGRIHRPLFAAHTHSVNGLLWLNDSDLLSVGDDRKLMIWRITSSTPATKP